VVSCAWCGATPGAVPDPAPVLPPGLQPTDFPLVDAPPSGRGSTDPPSSERPPADAARREPLTTSVPPTWTRQTTDRGEEWLCERCTRDNLRAIEARLDAAWW
jgi:hypothetical protein